MLEGAKSMGAGADIIDSYSGSAIILFVSIVSIIGLLSFMEEEAPYQGQPDAPSSGPEAPSAGVDKASGSGAASEALERAKGKRPLEVSPDDCKEVERGKRIHPSAPSGSEQGQAVREPAGVQGQPPMDDPYFLFLLKHQDNELGRQLLQLHKVDLRIDKAEEDLQIAKAEEDLQKGRTPPEGE